MCADRWRKRDIKEYKKKCEKKGGRNLAQKTKKKNVSLIFLLLLL
jgi:hypothetical protein